MYHWICLPPHDFNELTCSDKHQILWLSKHHHKINWQFGFEKYADAQKLIQNALKDVSSIYLKGQQKCDWIIHFLKITIMLKFRILKICILI